MKKFFLLVAMLSFLASWRLFRPGFFSMQDDMQVFRLSQMDHCFRDGQFPCRFIPDGGLGYGYPLFNYYSPLPYLIGEGIHLLSFSFIDSIKLVFIIGFFLSAIGMFLFSRQFFGPLGGLISAGFYLFAPYRAVDSFVRGSLGEFFALALLPFLFWSVGSKNKKWFIFFLTSLLLTHHLTALVTLPLLFLFLLLFRRRHLLEFFLPTLLSFGITAFFLLPVIAEKSFVTVETMTEGYFNFINHFVSLSQLFISRFWGYGASLWGPVDDMSFQIGLVHWLVPLIVIGISILRRRLPPPSVIFFFLLSFIFIFLTHSRSTFLWQLLPFMKYFQFPWRFLGFIVFCLSFVAGATINLFPKKPVWVTCFLLAAVVIANFGYFREDIWYPGLTDAQKLSPAAFAAQSGAGLRDYWPIYGATYPKETAPDSPVFSSGSGRILSFFKNSRSAQVSANVFSSTATVTFPIVYFPDWQLAVDGLPDPITYEPELGRITAQLTPGNHQLTLSLNDTPLRQLANAVSIFSLLIFLIYLLNLRNFYFWTIISLGFVIRFWNLGGYPASLNWDEISHGYNAYSLLKIGRDQWGSLPVFNFRAYGDYPTTLNLYLTVPFIALFGLTPFTIRLPGAIFSLLSIVIAYFLGRLIFKKNSSALVLMLLVAISPWTFFPARAVFQSNLAQFFLPAGLLCLLISSHFPRLFLPGSFLLGLSTFAYHNTRLIALPLFLLYLFLFRPKINFRHLLGLSFVLPGFLALLFSPATARAPWVSIIDQGAIDFLNEKINLFVGPGFLARLVYNKPLYFLVHFVRNYLDFIFPTKLFFTGTGQYQFGLPNHGVLFSLWLPFYYLGLIRLVRLALRRDRISLFLIGWFIIGLFPAAITKGDFPVIRATSILPLPHLIVTLGLFSFLSFFSRWQKQLLTCFILVTAIQFSFYLYKYFFTYYSKFSSSWQYGYSAVIAYARQYYFDYDEIVFTKKYGEPHEFILFYWPWDPLSFQSDPRLVWGYHTFWYWVDAFDKFRFLNDWEIKKSSFSTPKTLLITSPDNYPSSFTLLRRLFDPLGQPVFDIVSQNP